MPIPERGPVSLIPDQAQPQIQEAQDLRQTVERDKAERNSDLPHSLGEEGEAAVAAIAESLARSAAGSMAPDELVTAGDVDFSKLREEKKAEVTETFANAIQRENAPHDKRPLPTLLDEVFRRDFIREPSPVEEPADDLPGSKASDAYEGLDKQADDEGFGSTWGAPEIAVPITTGVRQARPVSNEPPPRATQEDVPVSPVAAREAEPVRPAASGSPLEEEVRGMLQPLLVQWLNEHMPRILETAIREEIATRGLSPKAEK